MNKSRLRPISDKQKERNKNWKAITDRKANDLNGICQWCGKIGSRIWWDNPWEYLDGHHTIKRRYNIHTYKNCYICHRLDCHRFIEDNNIDVREYPTKEKYEDYLISLWG